MSRNYRQSLSHSLERTIPSAREVLAWIKAAPSGGALPTFLLIGSPQSGSTWLYSNLVLHPDVNIPWKEMAFWSRYPAAPLWWYKRAFDPALPVRGDMTPHYGVLRPEIIHRIRSEVGNLQLVLIVRDPVARAWSAIRRRIVGRRLLVTRTVTVFLDDVADGYPGLDPGADYGCYEAIIRRWTAQYDRSSILVVRYSDIAANPEAVMTSLLTHIGADVDRFPWEKLIRSRVNANPLVDIPDEIRMYLESRYAGAVERTKEALGLVDAW